MTTSWTVGVTQRDLPGFSPADELATQLRTAALGGFDLLQVPDLAELITADDEQRAETDQARRETGVELVAGLGAVNAHRAGRAEVAARLGSGDPFAGWQQMITAAGRSGVDVLHFTVGVEEDRFDRLDPWTDQLAATARLLRRLAALAVDAGVTLVLKTHEEMTTFELVRLLDEVDSATLQVGFSPVNVLARLEDPVAALARVVDRVQTIFVDDAELVATSDGVARRMRCLAAGTIPWTDLLSTVASAAAVGARERLPLVLDLHRAELAQPLYAAGWLDHHPDLIVAELAAVAGSVRVERSRSDTLADRSAAGLAGLAALAGRPHLGAAASLVRC